MINSTAKYFKLYGMACQKHHVQWTIGWLRVNAVFGWCSHGNIERGGAADNVQTMHQV